MTDADRDADFDTIIIGSGFGGTGVAHELVAAGQRVLMLERGGPVPRGPENWRPEAAGMLTPHYSLESSIRSDTDHGRKVQGGYYLVGGPSVFYGGVSLRFREADFAPPADLVGESGAAWPLRYADLAPWYDLAEGLLGVAGRAGEDPCEPPRDGPYPQPPGRLAAISERIAAAGRALGLQPFRLPLAINYHRASRPTCIACTTCDGFACAISAKSDLATAVLPDLVARGLTLRPNAVVTRLVLTGDRVSAVEGVDRTSGLRQSWTARQVVLAAGALASPQLLLASGLERASPAGNLIGRYLQRHKNAIVFGFFRAPPDPVGEHHKQLGFHDWYFGAPDGSGPRGKLGSLQQLVTPPVALVRANVPRPIGWLAGPMVSRLTGLLIIAEDQPMADNRVVLDPDRPDRFGLPGLAIHHRYTARDRAAERALARLARRILRRAGALVFYRHVIDTFSHASGTVRMGDDPAAAPLDRDCRFRGVENLRVVDASFMPTSAAVNPSLTILANALRVGRQMAEAA